MRPELVIFDCDGVLVETETIGNKILSGFMKEIGLNYSVFDCYYRFTGCAMEVIKEEAERLSGKTLPADWPTQVRKAYLKAFETGIDPIPGVMDVVTQLKAEGVSFCVASSGRYEKMEVTLGSSGLWETFKDVLFSAQDCERGKPAPDIFLYAAKGMGYKPEKCAVIEDSIAGIKAALAARMRVFNYTGDVNADIEKARSLGAVTFGHMAELPALLSLKTLENPRA
ncbi:6-phosphogluconate phosphatase [Pseudovibrio axinellae]|uniref:6-phosphogluconate phosphatase n=1 Tax=Pseudovibrio axinellae TaxID=989403 RepID=A0A165Z2H2_9HYPH|nr:HAD family phosphatase [Pseudovibrio axinellae]KZL19456.1 6-phosphogluconate phosphatase [Pseudovibrio axinellae]SEQ27364.1 haloacid dehalogenase superfamily, subfamily IA, variant 3 with third motif having DD or ED [Pseudovibrio axinellae]